MKTKKHILLVMGVALGLMLYSCGKDYLNRPALGSLSQDVLANKKGVEALLIGAYAALDGQQYNNGAAQDLAGGNPWEASPDNWIYGSVAGGDAHKGSNAGDQQPVLDIAVGNSIPTNGFFSTKWKTVYEGISRSNAVLSVLKNVKDATDAQKSEMAGEARFLRAYFYFDLKKMFNMVPWISDSTTDFQQPNDKDIYPNIEDDFKFAMANLPETQSEVGRANKWAAEAFLAKVYMFEKKYQDAKPLFDEVISSGQTSNGLKYALTPQFEENFRASTENNSESVFAIQMAARTGSGTIADANEGDMLNYAYNSPFRCCGFYQPTQDLVNSYRTNPSTGLPYLNDYNQHAVKNDMGITSDQAFTPDQGTVDPRLDWTAGRRDIPYLDWGAFPGQKWVRDQSYSGPYAPKKNVYWQSTQDQYYDPNAWAPGTAINYVALRYADVLLLAAECDAQLGNLDEAEKYVNMIRNRAANPDGFVDKYKDPTDPLGGFTNTPAADYKVSPYPAGDFTAQGKDYALKAIYFERKLELAMEGHRFFDLARWGIAAQTLNAFYQYENTITTDLRGAHFTAGKNEIYPIPQRQIDLSVVNGKPTLKQNPGYQQ